MSTTTRGSGTLATLVPLLLGLGLGLLVPLAPQLRVWLQQHLGISAHDSATRPAANAAASHDPAAARHWDARQNAWPAAAAGDAAPAGVGPPARVAPPASSAPPANDIAGPPSDHSAAAGPAGPPASVRPAPFWDASPADERGPRAGADSSEDMPRRSASGMSGVAVVPTSHARSMPLPEVADQLDQLQRRFVALGAAYLRLEAWGAQRQLYRFRCEMPLPGNPAYHQYFESVDASPAAAMQRVLAAVEAWQARQQAAGPLR